MAKKLAGTMKLQIPAGQANPSPPVGPALGQRGINIMEFCKAFNAKTQEMEPGAPCPTIITYYQDKSFSMEIKTPRRRPGIGPLWGAQLWKTLSRTPVPRVSVRNSP